MEEWDHINPDMLLEEKVRLSAARRLQLWYGVYSNTLLAAACWPHCQTLSVPPGSHSTWLKECRVCCGESCDGASGSGNSTPSVVASELRQLLTTTCKPPQTTALECPKRGR
jgi:hypothetical protein